MPEARQVSEANGLVNVLVDANMIRLAYIFDQKVLLMWRHDDQESASHNQQGRLTNAAMPLRHAPILL
jgi:hypothetical protein